MGIAISAGAMSMEYDPVWQYVIELRRKRKVTQEKLAAGIGLSREGWRLIETVTEDPKTSIFLDAIRFLGGSWEDIQELAAQGVTKARALELARHRADYIAIHGLAAKRQTFSQQEIDDQLLLIEDAVTRASMAVPGLEKLVQKARGRPKR